MGDTPPQTLGDRLPQFLPKSPPMDVIKVLLGGERISRGKLIDHLVKFFMVSLHVQNCNIRCVISVTQTDRTELGATLFKALQSNLSELFRAIRASDDEDHPIFIACH